MGKCTFYFYFVTNDHVFICTGFEAGLINLLQSFVFQSLPPIEPAELTLQNILEDSVFSRRGSEEKKSRRGSQAEGDPKHEEA